MPANEVLGLSRAEANYRPILDLHAHMVGPHLLWSREQSPFSDAEVGSLSRWLFNELINAWACEQEQVQTKTDWRFSQIRALGDALVALARRLGRSSLAGPKTVPLRAVAH